MNFNLNYSFDENLREVFEDSSSAGQYVDKLLESLSSADFEQTEVLGEAGVFLRILNRLDEAQNYLEQAVQLLRELENRKRQWLVQRVRLAHVYQWQNRATTTPIMRLSSRN